MPSKPPVRNCSLDAKVSGLGPLAAAALGAAVATWSRRPGPGEPRIARSWAWRDGVAPALADGCDPAEGGTRDGAGGASYRAGPRVCQTDTVAAALLVPAPTTNSNASDATTAARRKVP